MKLPIKRPSKFIRIEHRSRLVEPLVLSSAPAQFEKRANIATTVEIRFCRSLVRWRTRNWSRFVRLGLLPIFVLKNVPKSQLARTFFGSSKMVQYLFEKSVIKSCSTPMFLKVTCLVSWSEIWLRFKKTRIFNSTHCTNKGAWHGTEPQHTRTNNQELSVCLIGGP